jgi:uncharacterized protein (DUF1697 family)
MPANEERHVALLRGINVGGGNLIKMVALKASFERLGLRDVVTYIASGNVIFSGPKTDPRQLSSKLETALSEEYGYKATVVLRSHRQLKAVVEKRPKGFGEQPTKFRCDVLFLKEPLTAAEAMKSVSVREGVDEAYAGNGVIYFSRLERLASRSHLPRLVVQPVYKLMTVRNWNTTTKLLGLMSAPGAA